MHQMAVILLAIALSSCGDSGPKSGSGAKFSDEHMDIVKKSEEAIQVSIDTGPFTESHLCKAAIHAVMGTSPSIMRTSEQFGRTIVAYNRKSDGKLWDYMCRLDGDRLVWGSNGGRWQNHYLDEYIRVSVDRKKSILKLHMIHSDNSSERF